jgi:hypothetical protein
MKWPLPAHGVTKSSRFDQVFLAFPHDRPNSSKVQSSHWAGRR